MRVGTAILSLLLSLMWHFKVKTGNEII